MTRTSPMSSPTPPRGGFLRRLMWTSQVARAQRQSMLETSRPTVIAVAALDNRMLTTPTSALIGLILEEVSELSVALIEGDTVAQPLRSSVDARSNGDLFGLVSCPHEGITRAAIESFTDTSGGVPVISAQPGNTLRLLPEHLDVLVPRAQHRWPMIILDLPFTVAPETIAAGTALASHVVLIADRYHRNHDWLYQPGHHLSALARDGKVTVACIGGQPSGLLQDTVALPVVDAQSTSHSRLVPSTRPRDIAMYYRLLARIFAESVHSDPRPR